ncbi:MAG TPA: helix-turn-helix domain-containing protein [Longimicrobium sp.]|nr:helix-turn-helix domain-containing protein [Longimicrobium sp.]
MRVRNLRQIIVLQPLAIPGLEELGAPYERPLEVEWAELDGLLREAAPATVLVANPYAGDRPGEMFPRVHEVLKRFPSLTVAAALELRPENVADVAMLVDWGVSEVIDLVSECTPRALQARLRQAHARPLKRRLEAALSGHVSGEARNILMAAAEVAVEGGGAPELAALLRLSPRSLTDRCARADLPPPRQVQAWMRILLACALLDDPGRTVYSAAFACGYSTDRSLRRAIATFLAADTTALRREGAFGRAVAAFNDVLRELRERGRERRRAAREETSPEIGR